jgi:hypothetical protein
VVVALLVLLWAFDGLSGLGLSVHGVVALVFYSNRSGTDDVAGGPGDGTPR